MLGTRMRREAWEQRRMVVCYMWWHFLSYINYNVTSYLLFVFLDGFGFIVMVNDILVGWVRKKGCFFVCFVFKYLWLFSLWWWEDDNSMIFGCGLWSLFLLRKPFFWCCAVMVCCRETINQHPPYLPNSLSIFCKLCFLYYLSSPILWMVSWSWCLIFCFSRQPLSIFIILFWNNYSNKWNNMVKCMIKLWNWWWSDD